MATLLRPTEAKKMLGGNVARYHHAIVSLGYLSLRFGTFRAYPETYLTALKRNGRIDPAVRSQVVNFNRSTRGAEIFDRVTRGWTLELNELAARCDQPKWLTAQDIAQLTGARSYTVGLWREQKRLAYKQVGGRFYYSREGFVNDIVWELPVE